MNVHAYAHEFIYQYATGNNNLPGDHRETSSEPLTSGVFFPFFKTSRPCNHNNNNNNNSITLQPCIYTPTHVLQVHAVTELPTRRVPIYYYTHILLPIYIRMILLYCITYIIYLYDVRCAKTVRQRRDPSM